MKKIVIAFLLMMSMYSQAAPASLALDIANSQVLIQEGDNYQRPIASITKLMTAMVVLDSTASLDEKLRLNRRVGTLLPQKDYTRLELLHALLVRSDNSAAETLAENYPGGRSVFVSMMNQKARDLELTQTKFSDPSGLGVFNVSTLYEVGVMLKTANSYDLIKNISTQTEIKLPTNKKSQLMNFFNTNYRILTQFSNIILSKTGYTTPAGFCVAMLVNQQGREVAVVILGEKNTLQRANTANRIMGQLVQVAF